MSLVSVLRAVHGLHQVQTPSVQAARPAVSTAARRVHLPVVSGVAPAFSLQSLLDQYLSSLDDATQIDVRFKMRGPRPDGVFHASEVSDGLVCRRYLAYGMYQAPRNRSNVDARVQRIFDNGHFVHARLESYVVSAVESAGGRAWNELSYKPDSLRRSGTADVGIVLNGWPYLVEIKSMRTARFAELGRSPPQHHRSQLNQYMGLSSVRAGVLLYENKDTQELREYFVRFSEDEWLRVEGVCKDVLTHVRNGTLPDKVTVEDGCDGDQCLYHAICKKRGGERWLPPGGKQWV